MLHDPEVPDDYFLFLAPSPRSVEQYDYFIKVYPPLVQKYGHVTAYVYGFLETLHHITAQSWVRISYYDIARSCHISQRAALRAVKSLTRDHYLKKYSGRKTRTTNYYQTVPILHMQNWHTKN